MNDLIDRISHHEGCRLTVYDDATGKPIQRGSQVIGNPTIGVGVLLCAPGGITQAESDYLLNNRVQICIAQVRALMPSMNSLNSARFDVLVEMAYQMGINGLKGFPKMLQAVNDQRWADAAVEMLNSLWAKQTPLRAQDLAAIMRSGQA